MVAPGHPNRLGGSQPVPTSLLGSNSGGQGGGMASQGGFSSMNMLGNAPNVSSLLHQSFGNMGANPEPRSSQRGLADYGAETDPLSGVGNGMGFSSPSTSYASSAMPSNLQQQFPPNSSGNQMLTGQQPSQQLDPQNIQLKNQQLQQFSCANNSQSVQSGLAGVKAEPQVINIRSQQFHSTRGLRPVKAEPQHSDSSLFLQQQQQQFLHMSRQSPRANAGSQLLHQQSLMHLQQPQQQQQHMNAIPQQRNPVQLQLQPQNRSPLKQIYEPGMCARRLTHYMYQQQHKPEDNNIEFWRKFVAEYFAPNAKKKWCVSMYGSGRQTSGVFPQDVWDCEICNRKPGRGFEATAEVLPRLFKIKYESGTLEELLFVDMPREYQNSSGQIVLDYAKAIQESVFEQLRVVRDGQLRLVFSQSDLKIVSWEFCARRHEELIPRRLLIPQVSQLGAAAQKYQAATQNASSNVSVSELQSNCNMFVASARQLVKALEVPLVNDLGYTKRYVRCLQISEVVNSMKDLIDYSRETGTGPIKSLAMFSRQKGASAQPCNDQTQEQQQQAGSHNSNHESSVQASNNSILDGGNGTASANTSTNGGFGSTGNGLGQAAIVNGIRAALGNNHVANGRIVMTMARDQSMSQQQQDLGNQLFSGVGAVDNGSNNLNFDWKPSP